MLAEGYIKLYRSTRQSNTWAELSSVQRDLMICLLMMTCFKHVEVEVDGKSVILNSGQVFTSLPQIQNEMAKGTTTKQIRIGLDKLKKLGFLNWENYYNGRIITIKNWNRYQSDDEFDRLNIGRGADQKAGKGADLRADHKKRETLENASLKPVDNSKGADLRADQKAGKGAGKEESSSIYIIYINQARVRKYIPSVTKSQVEDLKKYAKKFNITESEFYRHLECVKSKGSSISSPVGWIISSFKNQCAFTSVDVDEQAPKVPLAAALQARISPLERYETETESMKRRLDVAMARGGFDSIRGLNDGEIKRIYDEEVRDGDGSIEKN